jgi:hypothetical protein
MMSWKGCGRKRSWSNFKVPFYLLPGGTENNHERPLASRSLGLDLNPGRSGYERGVLTTRLRRTVCLRQEHSLH